MAVGEFISEETEVEMSPRNKTNPIISGGLMFASYFGAGFIPLLPIVLFSLPQSIYFSVIVALIGLFCLGLLKGKLTSKSLMKSGVQVAVVGGIATALGILVGIVFKV
jgi:VIT1/CCC1 family predicted Fe2+/Mn2+ transporter